MTFSPKLTSCLLKFSIRSDVWLTCPRTRHLVPYETNLAKLYILCRSCDFEFGLTVVSISVTRCVAARATCARADSVVSSFVDVTIARERNDWLGAKSNDSSRKNLKPLLGR